MLTQLPRYIKQVQAESQPVEASTPPPRTNLSFSESIKDSYIDNHESFERLRDIANQSHIFERRQKMMSMEQQSSAVHRLIRFAQRTMQNTMVTISQGETIRVDQLQALTQKIIDLSDNHTDALLYFSRRKTKSAYTYMRSVSFCILLVNFARTLGYSESDLRHIGIGALLHDAGKMWVPKKVLNKPGKLTQTEFREIKEHTKYTQLIFHNNQLTHTLSRNISQEHHERLNGSGYPNGARHEDISLIGQIAGIVDVYDAATSNCCYHDANEPTDVLKFLLQSSTDLFERDLVQRFIQHVGIYPVGTAVLLSNGLVGVVVEKSDDLLRPNVNIMYDNISRRPIPNSLLRLSQLPDIRIQHSIPEKTLPLRAGMLL